MNNPTLFHTQITTPSVISTCIMPNAEKYRDMMNGTYSYFSTTNQLISKQTGASTAVGQKHTPYRSHTLTNLLDSFYGDVERMISKYFNELGQVELPMTMVESWIVKYEKGLGATPHVHSPFSLGVTYYFDVEDRTPLQFYDSMENRPIMVTPSDGLLCIFPAHLEHSVPNCSGKRGCWASNWTVDVDQFIKNL
jgi:hypothetical protein